MNNSIERSSIAADIRLVLSSRFVIIILTIATICRLFFHFFALSNSPSGLGPDEGTYAALAKYVSQGLPVEEFPVYKADLYNATKTFILPSAFLVKLGLYELSAVRTVASLYGLASSLVLALCYLVSLRLWNKTFHISNAKFDRKFLTLLAIFTFFPSNFLWSIIGLRESGIQFWLMTTFYLILKLINSVGRDLLKFTALSSLALTLAHGTRPETALIFSLVAVFTSIVLLANFRKFLPLIAILFGILGGQMFTTTPQVVAKESLVAFQIVEQGLNPSSPLRPMEILDNKPRKSVSEKCNQKNELLIVENTKYRCKSSNVYVVVSRNPVKTLETKFLTAQNVENKRKINAIGAESAIPERDCQSGSRDILRLIGCNISEFSYRLVSFLFRPLIFLDQGSTALNSAALENVAWLLLIPLSFWVSFRKMESSVIRVINLSLIAFVTLFASAASLYEGNLGTAFRHKSIIIWPLIYVLLISPQIFPKFKTLNRFPSFNLQRRN